MRRILSIDGGGIKGVFPASLLATIERDLPHPIGDYFDLIAGTSTGGIIALGLGLGMSAQELLGFYEKHGPGIFAGGRLKGLRQWFQAKYDPAPLKGALVEEFKDSKLGDSRKRLLIPSFNLDTGEVHIWKTAHHARLLSDYRHTAVEVAMSTAAAPTFFPTYRADGGTPLVDGGMWANNPIAVAVVEAIGILGWLPAELRVLSLGCTTTPLTVSWSTHQRGRFGWVRHITDVFMTAQATSALGMAQHLIPDRSNIVRISPIVGPRYSLDDVSQIPSLRGLGQTEARKAIPSLSELFFNTPAPDDFVPFAR